MTSDFIPLLFILPIVIFIFAKQDFAKIFFYKTRIIGITLILILISPVALTGGLIPEASADNNRIKQIIKIIDTYPAGVASYDVEINPPLMSLDKAFVFYTVSHTGENDHSDTFKSIEIVDEQTLRLKGENTAAGVLALDFIAYVVEYFPDSDLNVQHLQGTIPSTTTGTETFTMGSVNTTNSMLIYRGNHHNATETSIGDEEFSRIRIVDPTTWEYFAANSINSGPQGEAVSILDWNQSDIRVIRDQGTLSPVAGSQAVTVTPASAVDPTRTMLLVTYAVSGGLTLDNDDSMVIASLTAGGDIIFKRADAEGTVSYSYQLIEYPADFVKVTHFNSTITGLTLDVTVPKVRDFDKTIAISTVGSPFGYSTGTGDEAAELPGAIDRSQATLQVTSNTQVTLSRDDSSGTSDIAWQLVEFLEPEFPEAAHGVNYLEQVIKIKGVFTAGNVFQDYTITPALTNVNKTMVFMTMNSTFQDGSSENGKLWEIINATTFRIIGSGDAVNDAAQFNAVFIEMNGTSPIFVQYDQLNIPSDATDVIKDQWISPVNVSNAFLIGQGSVMKDGDPTFGMEEFARVTLENKTTWRYETQTTQNNPETTYRTMITDLNDDQTLVQRGVGTLSTLNATITPPTAIQREQTLLFVNFKTSGGVFGETPDRSSLMATINSNNDIYLQRNSSAISLDYSWQTISFLAGQARIQHGTHSQNPGESNMTEFIPPFGSSVINQTKAFAIGTVGEYYTQSMGSCSSSTANKFDCAFGYMELINGSTLRLIRGSSEGSWDMGFQVTEFLFGSGGNSLLGPATDMINITDTVTGAGNFSRAITNTINVTDSIIASINRTVITSNTVNITDSQGSGAGITTSLNASRPLTNSINVTDTIGAVKSSTLSVSVNSTVTIDDPIVIVLINTTTPVPTVPPPISGGGGPPTVTPEADTSRSILTGLALSDAEHTLSSEIIVNPFFLSDSAEGVLELNWDQQDALRVTSIEVPKKFEQFIDFAETPIEYLGQPQFQGEDFATGGIQYEVTIPALTLGITQETNPFGPEVTFFDWLWILVSFNEYEIPVTVNLIHNNNEFSVDSTIKITQVREVNYIVIAILLAITAWLAWYGKRYFRDDVSKKSGSFKKSLNKAKDATIEKKPRGSFKKSLEKQRQVDRDNIRKFKKK